MDSTQPINAGTAEKKNLRDMTPAEQGAMNVRILDAITPHLPPDCEGVFLMLQLRNGDTAFISAMPRESLVPGALRALAKIVERRRAAPQDN